MHWTIILFLIALVIDLITYFMLSAESFKCVSENYSYETHKWEETVVVTKTKIARIYYILVLLSLFVPVGNIITAISLLFVFLSHHFDWGWNLRSGESYFFDIDNIAKNSSFGGIIKAIVNWLSIKE